ncbi:cancer-related nucleoside-triphosphatase-like protein isoform X1 [Cucumis melo var. makuwa]|uniref:Cancer-related nucleoside-triphosphatase-like protein isoform X1 n=1 Tax=Cucumis melo var. makuwa TaxID=1194695 RepID=A0A5A7UHA3_CUCMM|nr:cancer-related nucleoside-triphosphatase-like protein isoform X1 [Cucumis melo var. makuwa]
MGGPGRCLLVTGPPGVGKTTLIVKVFEMLKASSPNLKIKGFYTRKQILPFLFLFLFHRFFYRCSVFTGEIRQGSQRVGFEVVTLDGRTAPLASTSVSSSESLRWPTVGRYKVDIASFESLALPELQVEKDTDLFIIDEVGKMELFSSSFFPAVLKVLESNTPLLASIPIPKFGRDIPGGANILTLNPSNRDGAKEQIHGQILNMLEQQHKH